MITRIRRATRRPRAALAAVAFLVVGVTVLEPVTPQPAAAADGVILRSFTANAGACGVGVGLAFNGAELLVSCSADNVIDAVSPADGRLIRSYTVSGMTSIGALAWDRGRSRLWACEGFGGNPSRVWLADLEAGTATYKFSTNGCVDGLAYDATDDTIWASGDAASSVSHYRSDGTPLATHTVTSKIGSCGNSGIAIAGQYLILANNGCSQIYALPKDASSSRLFGTYAARLEDLECDDRTFASTGKTVIWSKDAYDNILNAFEIDLANCGSGVAWPRGSGVGVPKAQTWGSGSRDFSVNRSELRSDPVNTATGNFIDAAVDVGFAGVGPDLALKRFYNSADPAIGALGKGWTHEYNTSLAFDNVTGAVTLRTGDGQQLVYQKQPDGSMTGPPGAVATLVNTGTGYKVTTASRQHLIFDNGGRLVAIRDDNANTLTLTYDAGGRLANVADAASRTITFAYGVGDRLASVSTSDGRSVSYTYTGDALSAVADVRAKTTTYTHDTAGRIASIVDPNGHTKIANIYGADGRVTSQADAFGNLSTFAWNAQTQTSTFTDAKGAVWIDVYEGNVLIATRGPGGANTREIVDNDLNVTTFVDEREKGWNFTYDDRHNVTSVTRPDGVTESITYDAAGRPLTVTDATGAVKTYAYDATGNLMTITDALGKITTTTFDGRGLVTSITDAAGRVTTSAYDSAGNMVSRTDGLGNTTTFGYDAAGRVTGVTDPRPAPAGDPDGYKWTYAYDAAGNVTAQSDPLGNTTTFQYDAAGKQVSATDPAGAVTTFGYNAASEINSITDPVASTVTYTYDAAGNVVAATDPLGKTTAYAYDGRRNLTSVTDPLGRATTYAYDAADQMIEERSPLGNKATYRYDDLGRMVAMVDPRGNAPGANAAAFTWTYGYDAAGRLATITDPLSGVVSFGYDAAGRRTSSTDQNGRPTTYAYDATGLLVSKTEAGGVTTTYEYDAAGRPRASVDALGKRTEVSYDEASRVTGRRSPLGHRTTFGYDAAGRLSSVVDPRGNAAGATAAQHTWQRAYDAAGRLTRVTDPLGNATENGYDAAGRRTSTKAPTGETTTYGLDPVGRLTSVLAPDLTSTSYTYDAAGRQIRRTDAKNHVTQWAYDADGRLVERTAPGGGRWTYTYDAAGNVTSSTDPTGNASAAAGDGTTSYAHDGVGRVTGIAYSDETSYSFDLLSSVADLRYTGQTPDVTFGYDPKGNVTSMADGLGVENYTYDERDRVTAVTRGSLRSFAYAYDALDRIASRTQSDGSVDSYQYDDDGRVRAVVTPGGTSQYGYDPANNQTSLALPNGQVETRTYDRANRLNQIRTAKGATVLDDLRYTLRADGRPTRLDANGRSETYGYDQLSRVTDVCFSDPCGPLAERIGYGYDQVGNRTSETTRTGTTTATYDQDDRLTGETTAGGTKAFTYDPNGNLIGEGGRRYAYDGAERLTAVVDGATAREYAYNGHGDRVEASTSLLGTATTESTRMTWDRTHKVPQLAMERRSDNTVLRRYSYGNDLLSMRSGNGDHYFHHDRIGSVVGVTAASGTAEWAYTYDPFGGERTRTQLAGTAPTNPNRFAGEHLDPATDLYNLRAREYDPGTGRFTQHDPLEAVVGQPFTGDYAYANNDPLNQIDPLGLRASGGTSDAFSGRYAHEEYERFWSRTGLPRAQWPERYVGGPVPPVVSVPSAPTTTAPSDPLRGILQQRAEKLLGDVWAGTVGATTVGFCGAVELARIYGAEGQGCVVDDGNTLAAVGFVGHGVGSPSASLAAGLLLSNASDVHQLSGDAVCVGASASYSYATGSREVCFGLKSGELNTRTGDYDTLTLDSFSGVYTIFDSVGIAPGKFGGHVYVGSATVRLLTNYFPIGGRRLIPNPLNPIDRGFGS